jgi:anti-sigma factor RsiW
VSTDPYTHLDAAYLLGALEPAERADYAAHLAICAQCQAELSKISAIPPLLSGLDEAAFAVASDGPLIPPSEWSLPRLLHAVRRRRTRRRWLAAGLGLGVAAGTAAFIATALPLGGSSAPAGRAMTAVIASPVHAVVAVHPAPWGTKVTVTCSEQPGPSGPPEDKYSLVAHATDGGSYDLGSWHLDPGQKITVTSSVALRPTQIKNLTIVEGDGTAILRLTS